MKKILSITLFLLIFSSTALAESGAYLEPRIGVMIPWATGIGFKGGVLAGYNIDSVVSLNANLDYYRTSYSTVVSETNTISGGINQQGLDSQVLANLLLLAANCRVSMPFIRIADIITPYVQVGISYEVMFNTYQQNGVEDTNYWFGDFGIPIELGAQLNLGEKTNLFLSVGYNICSVSRSAETDETLIVGEKIDVSGFSLQSGIQFLF